MNWLGKVFKKKKKSYPQDIKYQLLIIDEKAELFHEIIGVSEERAQYLLEVCLTSYKEYQQLHSALEAIVNECSHTNEIVFSTMMFQKIVDRENAKDGLLTHLKSMFGNG